MLLFGYESICASPALNVDSRKGFLSHIACTFKQALEKHLAPRLRITGGTQALEEFGAFINKQPLDKGNNIFMLWRGSDNLEVTVRSIDITDLSKVSSRHITSRCKVSTAG